MSEIAPLYDEFYLLDEVIQTSPKENEKNKKSLIFLGGNKLKIVWVIREVGGISDLAKELLDNLIINAIKISWEDIALVNLEENKACDLQEIIAVLQPKKVIYWGCMADIELYKVENHGQMEVLSVESIGIYLTDIVLKRKLWESIKQLLNLQ